MNTLTLAKVELLGGTRSFSADHPAMLACALFIQTGLSSGHPELEKLKTMTGYGEPGENRIVLRIPAVLAKEKLGVNIRWEFPPVMFPDDEKAMYDFQQGRWGEEGQKLVEWIKSSYESVIVPALPSRTPTNRYLELESTPDGIRAKAVPTQS